MSRTVALCGLGLATGNEICGELPAYRIEARTYDGRRVVLQLCSNHIHRAWQLAQSVMDKKYPNENLRVRSIHLHQVSSTAAKSAAAEAAS
jgi:hypothetical protein